MDILLKGFATHPPWHTNAFRGRPPHQKPEALSDAAEKAVRDIKRATRRHFSAEDKIRIVIAGLRGEDSIGGYEIEHIWANHAGRHTDEFAHPSEFQEYRNRIGGLLLLPKSFNASYGDLAYAEKREHYLGQNLLARSLHEKAYEHNPGFNRFIEENAIAFRPCQEFKKADLEARQKLYQQLAERIWNSERLRQEAES